MAPGLPCNQPHDERTHDMLWLYLHFPQLLLDHLRRSSTGSSALAVVSGHPVRVIQACPLAREQGVVSGQSLKTALNLCPDIHLRQLDDFRQQDILEQQAAWLYRYLDRISLYPPDGLLADAGSVRKLYRGLEPLQRALGQALRERQLTASPGLGQTPLAARLTTRAGTPQFSPDPDQLQQSLSALPLTAAEFEPTTEQRLLRLGLTRIGDLLQLPAVELARRLGPEALSHLQKIQGIRPDPRPHWQPPHRYRGQADFPVDIEHSEGLLFPIQRLLGDLESDMLWRQQATDSLKLILHHRQHEPTRLLVRSTGPAHKASDFLELLRLQLEQHPLAAPVHRLELDVRRFLDREQTHSGDLLTPESPDSGDQNTLLSRLQARLGPEAVRTLTPRADHRPELAWCAQAPAQAAQPVTSDNTPVRPLWLLQTPQPLLTTPGQWLAGPERICSGWWDGHSVQRDYYVAHLTSGQLAWVYRDIRDGWFIHGWFA